MVNLVLDANIPISLKSLDVFDKFVQFFTEETGHRLIMSNENLNECGSIVVRNKLLSLKSFNKINDSDKSLIQQLKSECEKLKIRLHSNKDADFHVIAVAIKNNADFIVTNDRGISEFHSKTRNPQFKKINILNLAGMLYFMYNLRKDIFDSKIFTKLNLDSYEIIEIENYFKIMHHQDKFININEKVHWQNHLINVYRPYSANIMKIFT